MDAADLATASRRFVLHSLRRDRCVTFTRGDNARLWDADGREYLDTMSGSAGPAMVGHANPRVAAAVAAQMATLPTTNILHQSDAVIAYCEGVMYPIHAIGVNAMGLYFLDSLYLEDLAAACASEGRSEFLCLIAPLRLAAGTGSPVNPIAVL